MFFVAEWRRYRVEGAWRGRSGLGSAVAGHRPVRPTLTPRGRRQLISVTPTRRFVRAIDAEIGPWGAVATPTEAKKTIAQDAATGKPHVSQDYKGVVSTHILHPQLTCRTPCAGPHDDRQGPARVLGPLPAGPSWSGAHDCHCRPYMVRRCLTWTSWWRVMGVHVCARVGDMTWSAHASNRVADVEGPPGSLDRQCGDKPHGSVGAYPQRGTQALARESSLTARSAAARTRGTGSSRSSTTAGRASPTRCRATTLAANSRTRHDSSRRAMLTP
jgi:hypothetical protein